jgi:hypothetical protein
MTESSQRIAPATTLGSLKADLDAGLEVELCFLFGEPRRNWTGLNNSVKILRQITIDNTVAIEGVLLHDGGTRYVALMIDLDTGNGNATFGAELNDEDLRVLEVSFAAINATASTTSTVA